jgi:hypothetical protein
MRAMLIAAALLLAMAAPSEALRNRGTDAGVDDCLIYGGDHECDDTICYCCYADGCWICGFDDDGNAYMDCVWDGAYSSSHHPRPKWKVLHDNLIQGGGKLQISPDTGTKTKPPLRTLPLLKKKLAPAQ